MHNHQDSDGRGARGTMGHGGPNGSGERCDGLVDGLRTPMAVLRASLEALAFRFEERDPRQAQVVAAIAQVARLQHNVLTLIEDRLPTPVALLSCTLQEIVTCAVNALVPEHRARTLVAVESGARRILVDGPIVSRSLTRLIESGLDNGSHVTLLRAHAQADRASFHVLHGPARGDHGLHVPSATADSFQALAQRVAERDVARMGGTFRRRSTLEHAAVFELAFELARAGEEAA